MYSIKQCYTSRFRFTLNLHKNGQGEAMNSDEKFEPLKGEYCWFYSTSNIPILGKFIEMSYKSLWIEGEYKRMECYKADVFGHYFGFIGPKDEDYLFPYCEKFTGELPKIKRDKINNINQIN